MNYSDLEQLHGHDLARAAMREVYDRDEEPPAPTRDHGGLPINGDWAFNALRHARQRYAVASAGGRLPALKSGVVSFDRQVVQLDDGTEVRTRHSNQYEAQCAQAIVLVRLGRAAG